MELLEPHWGAGWMGFSSSSDPGMDVPMTKQLCCLLLGLCQLARSSNQEPRWCPLSGQEALLLLAQVPSAGVQSQAAPGTQSGLQRRSLPVSGLSEPSCASSESLFISVMC